MKAWNFKAKNNPKEVVEKLDSTLGSLGGFVFNTKHEGNDKVQFKLRKRVLYPHQILHRNRIVINGNLLPSSAKNETQVDIVFSQNILVSLTIFNFFLVGLFAIYLGMLSGGPLYLVGGVLIAVGMAFWFVLRQKFDTETQKYKALISDILDVK